MSLAGGKSARVNRLWRFAFLLALLEWVLLNIAVSGWALFWKMRDGRATGLGLVYSKGMLLEITAIMAFLTAVNFLVLRRLRRRPEPQPPLAFPDSRR